MIEILYFLGMLVIGFVCAVSLIVVFATTFLFLVGAIAKMIMFFEGLYSKFQK